MARIHSREVPVGRPQRQEQPLLAAEQRRRRADGIPRRLVCDEPEDSLCGAVSRHTQYLQARACGVCAPSQLPRSAHGKQAWSALHDTYDVLTELHNK